MLVFLLKVCVYSLGYLWCMYNIGITGQSLYWIMWEAVRRLEEINLKVH